MHAARELIVGGPGVNTVLAGRNEWTAVQLGAKFVERHDAVSIARVAT